MQVTHDNDCEHRLGHDCTCGASNHLLDLAAARAEIERLKDQVEMQRKLFAESALLAVEWERKAEKSAVEAEFFKSEIKLRNRIPSTNDTAADLLRRAEKAEAERDAIAAAALEAATSICADQFAAHMTAAIYGDPDNSRAREAAAAMAERLLHRIRALTPADAKAALEAYGREKVREGMQRAADLIDQNFDRNGWSAHKAILAEMEKLK